MGPEVGGRADDDAVKIVWVALRLHQRLATTIRAAIEIGPLRPLTGECCYNRLRLIGSLFERPISEVDNFLRMPERENSQASRLTAVICRGSGIASPDRIGETAISDAAAEPTTAELFVFSVEAAVSRYPDLEVDD